MACREDLRRCKRVANGQNRGLVGSQDEENVLAQTAQPSWLNGGEAQRVNVQSSTRSDWAVLASDGIPERSTASSAGPRVSSQPGVTTVRRYEGERLQVTHMCLRE